MKVDLSGTLRVSLDRALAGARASEVASPGAAAAEYLKAARLMESYAGYARTREDELRRRLKSRQYRERSAALGSGRMSAAPARGPRVETERRDGMDGEATPYSRDIRAMVHRSSITWEEIGGLEETKRQIKFTYGLALARKPDGVSLATGRRMLFYGPPGTGKTLLAAATSNGLGATFFNVKTSGVLSKYFGESSRLIAAVFDAARSEADEGFAVVFIDEVEALCLPRDGSSESGAERRILSTILSELDGLAEKGDDRFVLTVAATNAPWDLDEAVLSRFQRRIYIPLPDAPARKAILEILLIKGGHRLDYSIDEIVRRTEWFSGRDLERLASQAVGQMVEEMNEPIPAVVDEGRDRIREYRLRLRPLTKRDFDRALDITKVDEDRCREMDARFRQFSSNN